MNTEKSRLGDAENLRFRWCLETGILDVATLDTCRNYLEKYLESRLGQFHGLNGVEIAGEFDERLNSIDRDRISLEDLTFMRGQFPLEVRLSQEVLTVARRIYHSNLLNGFGFGRANCFLHMPPMVRYVLPKGTGAGVPAHVDRDYNAHMRQFVTTWVPLVEIDSSCGGVRVFESTTAYRDSFEDSKAQPTTGAAADWHVGHSTHGLKSIDCSPMSPGDVLLFGDSVLHESMSNTSLGCRLSIDLRWFMNRTDTLKTGYDFSTEALFSNA